MSQQGTELLSVHHGAAWNLKVIKKKDVKTVNLLYRVKKRNARGEVAASFL